MVLLITNRVPPDGVGLMVIVALILTGTATPMEAFAGAGHPATLTVASVLILSAGIQRTGVADRIAYWLRRHVKRSERRLLWFQTLLVSPLSAFISNTATVAVFLPVILSICRDRGMSPSKFLMPLSYAAILGGMCTVIGTSTNIVVASFVDDHGLEPMGMFDFFPIGFAISVVGFIYLTTIGPKLIPMRRRAESLATDYLLRRYITEVEILPGSDLLATTLERSNLATEYDLDVLEVHRGLLKFAPNEASILAEGDVLIVRAPLASIRRLEVTEGLRLHAETKVDQETLQGGGMLLAEAVVPPGSPLDHRTLKNFDFRHRFGVTAIALYRHRETISEKVGWVPIHLGDVLLLYGSKTRLRALAAQPEILSLVQVHPPRPRKDRATLCILILAFTVIMASVGLVSLVQAVVGGAFLVVLTRCLNLREAYRALDRRTLFLLAGMISLGLTLERSGAAAHLAGFVTDNAAEMGPFALLVATYLCTLVLTELITNNACAVVMTPIAIVAAQGFGLDPRPYAFAVAFASSASFLTPFGYQTNLFVYGPGGYRFLDFARMGLPLSIICFVTVVSLIPLLWPLVPGP